MAFIKSKSPFFKVFPVKFFNPLIILPIVTFFWGAQNLLEIAINFLDKYIPPPPWFWELFNHIFEGDYGWFGALLKVSVVAPIVEELIFRGLILQGFRRNYNAFVAVLMSALVICTFSFESLAIPCYLYTWTFARMDCNSHK